MIIFIYSFVRIWDRSSIIGERDSKKYQADNNLIFPLKIMDGLFNLGPEYSGYWVLARLHFVSTEIKWKWNHYLQVILPADCRHQPRELFSLEDFQILSEHFMLGLNLVILWQFPTCVCVFELVVWVCIFLLLFSCMYIKCTIQRYYYIMPLP